jgi:hypothetical protein
MADWQAALKKAGLEASPQAQAETEVEKLNLTIEKTAAKKREGEEDRRFQILHETESVSTFRREARRLLTLDWRHIHQIVNVAHDQGMKAKSPKLIARLLDLRNNLPEIDSGRKKMERIDDALIRGW